MAALQTIETTHDIAIGLDHLIDTDPALAAIVDAAGEIPLRRSAPGFESLAGIIISQQVSRQSADAITARLTALINPLTPDHFMAAGEDVWRQVGLSRPKQRTLIHVSQAVLDGTLDLYALCAVEAQAANESMTAIKGIGPWTADIYLLFAAGHRDIFPAGDLALQAAVGALDELDTRPDASAVRIRAESWAPWRGVAARLLWAWYGKTIRRTVLP